MRKNQMLTVLAGVKAEVRARDLDGGGAARQNPLLVAGAVAVADVDRSAVCDIALHVKALRSVSVRVKDLAGGRGRRRRRGVARRRARRPLLVRVVGDARPGLRAGAVGEDSVGQVEALGA